MIVRTTSSENGIWWHYLVLIDVTQVLWFLARKVNTLCFLGVFPDREGGPGRESKGRMRRYKHSVRTALQ